MNNIHSAYYWCNALYLCLFNAKQQVYKSTSNVRDSRFMFKAVHGNENNN